MAPSEDGPAQIGGIRREPRCLPYLGTNIYHSPADLVEGNIGRALRGLKGSLAFWSTLRLTVAGRIALLKMVALPRLLYYFRTLPIWLTGSTFRQLRSLVGVFLWGTGRLQVALDTMMRPRADGGLAVPDFELYCLAAQLQWLTQAVALGYRGHAGPEGSGYRVMCCPS